jgi:peptidoglycan/xylan/chitin deacetylase (PgdA/CDA1 family)
VARPSHRHLTTAEVRKLGQGTLSDIGAHTVTHPVLAGLTREVQAGEVVASKVTLENILERPVTTFAYPHGAASDYSEDSVAVVKAAGFSSACAAVAGLAGATTDHFQLPREGVADVSGRAFARWLADRFRPRV